MRFGLHPVAWRRLLTLAAAVALPLGLAAAAWIWWPAAGPGPCVVVSGPAPLPELAESSDLAISARSPGVLWSHNDSGNAAVLFAVDTAGAVRGRVRVPIRTRDWEDISAARCASGALRCEFGR